jgi:hypothetical protein
MQEKSALEAGAKKKMLSFSHEQKVMFLKRERNQRYENEDQRYIDQQLTNLFNQLGMEPEIRETYYNKSQEEKLQIIKSQTKGDFSNKVRRPSNPRREEGLRPASGTRTQDGSRNSATSSGRLSVGDRSRNSTTSGGRGERSTPRRSDGNYSKNPRLKQEEEKSPGWYISQLANRNTTPKSLSRTLISLSTTFSLAGSNFVRAFLKKTVLNLGPNGISGVSSLEVALDRVCLPSLQPEESKSSSWYADSISPDELRLEVINCVSIIMKSDFGMNAIMNSHGLLRQIFWCLAIPSKHVQEKMIKENKLGRAYLQLHGSVFGLFGPACLLDELLKEY